MTDLIYLYNYNRAALYPQIADKQWNDWKWQMANQITTAEQAARVLKLNDGTADDIARTLTTFRMAVTPHYLCLINFDDQEDPVRKQALPLPAELHRCSYQMDDPLHEDADAPVPGLTHRYPDRVLFLVSGHCAMYCRHCTRRRFAGKPDSQPSKVQYEKAFEYIRNHPDIRDVLLSGGDPLLLSDDTLDYLLTNLRAIEHVEVLRIGSRIPVVLPQRITENLCTLLKKHHPLWFNTHFNHPAELAAEPTKKALAALADAGVPLGNQTVLLKGVNDSLPVMKKLMHLLVQNRVRPYYLYQCDLSVGLEHFRTPVGKGLEIMEGLRGHTSGFCVPTYVIDAPGGGGKIPLMPNYVLNRTAETTVLRNYEGTICEYPEPERQ